MHYLYPIIEGKKEKHSFIEDWSEAPVTSFIEWNRIALELDEINKQIVEIYQQLYQVAEKLELEKISKSNKTSKHEREVKKLQKKLQPLTDKQHQLELEGVSFFCSIPIDKLAEMPIDLEIFDSSSNSFIDVEINDSHFQAYKNRLELLASKPLSTESIDSFKFQTKTDDEIEKLEEDFKKLSFFQKRSKRGKRLKRAIKKSKCSTYKIKDIWLQSTLANKEFQDIANSIIKQFEKGDFSELIYLVSMLTVESNVESKSLDELREQSNQKTYIENYRDKFLEIYKNRVEVFTKQEKKLDVDTMMKLKNFFLLKWKIYPKVSKKF